MVRIAAVGDSLIQGFMSGAISRTTHSMPAMIARSLGLRVPSEFRVPRFPGSGLPLNIEEFLWFCTERLGPDITGTRDWLIRFPSLFSEFADRIEDLYERGAGSRAMPFGGTYHNLAVWGFRVFDSYSITPAVCDKAIEDEEGWIDDDFLGLPSAPMFRAAKRVLNPRNSSDRADTTQIKAVGALAKDEGLDAIILSLGANDCLGTVLSLSIDDMEDADGVPDDPIERSKRWNLTSVKQFEDDYEEMAKQLKDSLKGVPAKKRPKIFVGTVPHVTIPPVTRGIGRFSDGYYDVYGRFFARESSFNRWTHSHLTRDDAIKIDARIDAFNKTIREVAGQQKWTVVEVSETLDNLAVRRNGFDATPGRALVDYFARLGITDHPLLHLDPVPSILRIQANRNGVRTGGGLFSLDCVHPTTSGYGIMADLFLRAMQKEGIEGADPQRLDWQQITSQDSLIRQVPPTWDDVVAAAQGNPWLWDTLFSVLG